MYENRLVSLAAQKFVSDVANDALQHCKMRSAGQTIKNSKNKDRKFVMTMEDLGQALGNQGVTVKKPPYYTWIKYPFVEEYPPVSLFSEVVTTVLAAETIEKSKKFKKGNPVPALAFKFALHVIFSGLLQHFYLAACKATHLLKILQMMCIFCSGCRFWQAKPYYLEHPRLEQGL